MSKQVAIPDVMCKAQSEKAILVVVADEEHWIPQSCVHEDSEVFKRGQRGKLVISKSIAREKGIEDYGDDHHG